MPECIFCGSEQVMDVGETQLEPAGYLHEDHYKRCGDCGEQWVYGVPRGDSGLPDVRCPDCGTQLLVHFINLNSVPDDNAVHWKCPRCFYVTNNRDLIRITEHAVCTGYPQLVGELE